MTNEFGEDKTNVCILTPV